MSETTVFAWFVMMAVFGYMYVEYRVHGLRKESEKLDRHICDLDARIGDIEDRLGMR